MPGVFLVQVRIVELLAHGWDLARATGQPADYPAAWWSGRWPRPGTGWRPAGRPGAPFAAEVPVPAARPPSTGWPDSWAVSPEPARAAASSPAGPCSPLARTPAGWAGGTVDRMATDSAHRAVSIERTAPGRFTAVNSGGGQITLGTGGDERFTPTELLLAAIGSCTAIDVDILTARRAEPESFQVAVEPRRSGTPAVIT